MDRLSDVDRFHFVKMPQETLRPISRATKGNSLFQDIAYGKEGGKN